MQKYQIFLFLILLTSSINTQTNPNCAEFIDPNEKLRGCKICKQSFFVNKFKYCDSCPLDCLKCTRADNCEDCKGIKRYDNRQKKCIGGEDKTINWYLVVGMIIFCTVALVLIFCMIKRSEKEPAVGDGNELEQQLGSSDATSSEKDRRASTPTNKGRDVVVSKGNKFKDVEQVNSKAYKDNMENEEYPEFKVFSGGYDDNYDKNNTHTGL